MSSLTEIDSKFGEEGKMLEGIESWAASRTHPQQDGPSFL